jgi:hypothetical protein
LPRETLRRALRRVDLPMLGMPITRAREPVKDGDCDVKFLVKRKTAWMSVFSQVEMKRQGSGICHFFRIFSCYKILVTEV